MRSRRAAPRTQLQGLVDDLRLQWARRVPHPGAQLHGTALSSGPTGGMGATSQRVAAALRTQSTGTRTPRPPQSTAQRGSPVPTALAVPRSSGRVAGTRSQRQRGQGRLKQGSPHPTAVSGCLLGRRRAVRRGVGGGRALPGSCGPQRARARGVTGAPWGSGGAGRSRRTAGSSLPFLRSAERDGGEKRQVRTCGGARHPTVHSAGPGALGGHRSPSGRTGAASTAVGFIAQTAPTAP